MTLHLFDRFIRYSLWAIPMVIVFSCSKEKTESEERQSQVEIIITPNDYRVVSNPQRELLSCSSVSSLENDGTMTVFYLADEDSPIETAISQSIFIRASRFNVYHPDEQLAFYDIARINTSLWGHNCGNFAPYEPNVILRTDDVLMLAYREGGLTGRLISCLVNTTEKRCYDFREMTLDENVFDSVNYCLSYQNITNSSIPLQVITMTTRVVNKNGYYYTHVGGYDCNGIVIRSKDGLNWESLFVPSEVVGASYILEGALGEDPQTGHLFLCGRGDGIVFYAYDETFNEISLPIKIQGAIASKPSFFVYRNELFLIVNMENDPNLGNGRRNTANIYKVNGENGYLTLFKSLKCKDGCAYHTVQVLNDDVWVVFQTDARQIAPETQGRSNLALYKLDMTK